MNVQADPGLRAPPAVVTPPATAQRPPAGLLRILRRRRWWIVGTTMVALAAAVALAELVQPHYTAATRILYAPPARADVARTEREAAVESQALVLAARGLLARVVAEEKLAAHPAFGARRADLRTRLLARLRLAREPADPAAKALHILERSVATRRIGDSLVFEVAVTTPEPALSARIADAIARLYVAEEAGRQAGDAGTGRGDALRERLREAEARIAQMRAEHNATDPFVTEQMLREASARLVAARTRVAELGQRLDRLRALERRPDAEDVPDTLQTGTLAPLRAALAAARAQAGELSARLGPRHPAVASAETEQREALERLRREVARLARAAASERDRARADEAAIAAEVERLRTEVLAASEAAARLRELERDAAVSRAAHDAYLAGLRAREAGAAAPTPTRVIAPALAPAVPSSPPRLLVIAAGLLLGLGLGSGLALLAERLDDRLREIDRFAAVAGVPVLAVLPDGRRLSARRFGTLARAETRGERAGRNLGIAYPSAERLDALYRLASALGIAEMGPAARTVVFTSPEPTDERPACAIDLGLAVAAGGRAVVIVDADTRGRQLSRLVGAQNAGIVEVIEGQATLADAALSDHLTGLQVVPLARASAPRFARFAPERIRTALAAAADEPADLLLDVSDPHDQSIAPSVLALADAVVVVVRNGVTHAETLRRAMAALRNAGARVTGLVVVV